MQTGNLGRFQGCDQPDLWEGDRKQPDTGMEMRKCEEEITRKFFIAVETRNMRTIYFSHNTSLL
jgi:hypothetical protein